MTALNARTFLVLALGATTLSAVSAAHAQGMRTATGQNPLDRISGADYAGNGALGRTQIAPSYTSRYAFAQVRGGSSNLGYYWTPQRSGNGVDPRTGVSSTSNQNNPFLYPYVRSPGGQLGGGVKPAAPSSTPVGSPAAATVTVGQSDPTGMASGIVTGSTQGAYVTNNTGAYYMGGGVNTMAYPGGISTVSSPYAVNGMGTMPNGVGSGTNGSSYNYGISSYGMASATNNPYITNATGQSAASMISTYGAGYGYTSPTSMVTGYGVGYTSATSLVPGIVGAAVGALVGRHFGMVGLIAGGVGGFLLGEFLANQARQMPFAGITDNTNAMIDTQLGNQYSYYHGLYDYYGNSSGASNLGPLPGVAGAVLGALIGKFGGVPGMLIGGVLEIGRAHV